MKIFVAGSTGVIGRLLLPKLVHTGHEVFGMTQNEQNKDIIQKTGARPLIIDAFDREAIISTILEVRPEAIIHQLTSLSSRNFSENTRIRVEGTRNLVDAALIAGVSESSSISFAYEPGQEPASEDVSLDVNAPKSRKTIIDGVTALERAVAENTRYRDHLVSYQYRLA